MGLFTASYFIGSIYEVNQKTAQTIMEQFNDLIKDIDMIGIFSNNTSLAVPMFIPGFGIAWGAIAAWSTGQVFSAIQVTNPDLITFPSLYLLYLSPFGILELFAYSLAMSRSFLLIKSILQKKITRQLIRPLIIEVIILILVLFFAAVIEDYLIQQIESLPEFSMES